MKTYYKLLLALLFLLNYNLLNAQNYTISGVVKDAQLDETLPGASIKVVELGKGATTDFDGFFKLELPAGKYTLKVFYVGYIEQEQIIDLTSDQTLNFSLSENIEQLNEVVITAERQDANITAVEMSTEELTVEEIKKLPAPLGEPDVVNTLKLLPGVSSVGEGASGFNVRGGGTDQNYILWNEAPIYVSSHLFGFFSVFNSDALKDLKLYKGAIPAQYGGRLSSVLDIHQREGDDEKLSLSGGIGLVSAKLTVTAPIQKEKSSFLISARRSLFGFLLKAGPEDVSSNDVYFQDLNIGLNFKLNEKNSLAFYSYYGVDSWTSGTSFEFKWGNFANTLNWKHTFNDRIFSNTSLIYSSYDYTFGITDAFASKSKVQNYLLNQNFKHLVGEKHTFNYGLNVNYYVLTPGGFKPEGDFKSIFTEIVAKKEHALDNSIYISDEYKISDRVTVSAGLRFNHYTLFGEKTVYDYQPGTIKSEETRIDSTVFGKGEVVDTYYGLEPRLGVRVGIDSVSSVKVGYQRMRQNIFLISNSASGLPIDRWKMVDPYMPAQTSDQYSLGYFRNFKENTYEGSVEVYYKTLNNQVDYINGADIFFFSDATNSIETELLIGKGRAYGAEFMLKKAKGRFTGWVSYTLSRTERKVDGPTDNEKINRGKWYPSAYDKTHDLSVVAMYELSKRVTISGNFVYATGRPQTYPDGKYDIQGSSIANYSSRNAYRIPAYHRMDLSLRLENKKNFDRRFKSTWAFSVYNIYARKNAFSYIFNTNEDDQTTTEISKLSILGTIIPTVAYEFKF